MPTLLHEQTKTRHCTLCKEVKHIEEFHKGARRCKPCAIEAAQEWAENNRERRRVIARTSAARYREKYRLRLQLWRRNNPEESRLQNRLSSHVRRARVRKCGGKVTKEEWLQLLEQYGNKCLCCGKSDILLTMDHVVPLSAGGPNTIDNMQPLCSTCNYRKQTKTIDYRYATAA